MTDRVLVVVIAYNQPSFLGLQLACLQKFMVEPFTFVVYNNADNAKMENEIATECTQLNVSCIRVPQEVHKNQNNPSNRCAKSLQYAYDKQIASHRPYSMVLDTDMFLIRKFSIVDYLQGFDMAGIYQTREHIHYITNQLIMFHTSKLVHPWEITWDCGLVDGVGTDVGGTFHNYMTQYPFIELKRIETISSQVLDKKELSKTIRSVQLQNYLLHDYGEKPFSELYADQTFLHLRAGSNWCEMPETTQTERITNLRLFLKGILLDSSVAASGAAELRRVIAKLKPTKKVLSFSLYNNNPKYNIGALCNCLLAPIIYPGWICRFYVDETLSNDMIKVLQLFQHVEIVHMVKHKGSEAMFWRFLPSLDETVDVMLSRDADSWLTYREAEAVRVWLTKHSTKKFHILRDHCYHSFPIMGGMWGVRSGVFPPALKHKMTYFVRGDTFDQRFLANEILPLIGETKLIHSSPQWNFQHKFLPNGYFDEKYSEIPKNTEIKIYCDEPLPGLSFSDVYKMNEFECCHCQKTHPQFIGAILEKIPQKTIQTLEEFLKTNGFQTINILGK